MNRLIINTVLPKLQIVVSKDTQVFGEILEASKRHNEVLLPTIESLLRQAELAIQDIDEIYCFVGPGSFTGIRVGVATTKALRDALGVKALGMNTLEYLQRLSVVQDPTASVFALYGSMNSYFVAHLENDELVIEKVNQTKDQLLSIANGRKIYMFADTQDEDFAKYVDLDNEILLDMAVSMPDTPAERALMPVYFQLSQAEAQKINKNVDIIEATEKDLDWLVKADNMVFEDKWTREYFATSLSNGLHKIFIAKLLDDNIGFIDLEIVPDEVSIMKVAVLPEYRRNNVATQLVNRAKAYTKEQGIDTLSLEVSENNIQAKSLYTKLGFATRRIRKNYYKDHSNAIEMTINV